MKIVKYKFSASADREDTISFDQRPITGLYEVDDSLQLPRKLERFLQTLPDTGLHNAKVLCKKFKYLNGDVDWIWDVKVMDNYHDCVAIAYFDSKGNAAPNDFFIGIKRVTRSYWRRYVKKHVF